MVAECILIPPWLLCIVGLSVGAVGVYTARYYVSDKCEVFSWVAVVSVICTIIGFIAFLMTMEYYVFPLLPCVTVMFP
jgi:CHASE2 domain-containing sensor protein